MVGCCLVDRVYNNISFTDPSFSSFLSKRSGDGGLTPGKLVFKEEFETFCHEELANVLNKVTKAKEPDKMSIGGPGIVPLIHVGQMLYGTNNECHFYGCSGNDDDGMFIRETLKHINLSIDQYCVADNKTPSTTVLSDPEYDNGHGERIFINSIGAAWDYDPEFLDDNFFASDIVVFGGTALVPQIHENLTELLEKAKVQNSITVVNTVYDFKNEKENPNSKWPLGRSDKSYKNIDLLITDYEEALRLSGEKFIKGAIQFFRNKGLKALIITNGPNNIKIFCNKQSVFMEEGLFELPVANIKSWELPQKLGDTTGCGDNFAGGVIASLVFQLQNGNEKLDLLEACTWGVVSGGFACFHVGGTYVENYPGEKRELITFYHDKYIKDKIVVENKSKT